MLAGVLRTRLPLPFNHGPVYYNIWQYFAVSLGWARRLLSQPLAERVIA
jgi:hypothetical protein|tara:strand:+ start:1184 stop:1330 length:147 start_codon:yes stop_codon:yes gene_type:complete